MIPRLHRAMIAVATWPWFQFQAFSKSAVRWSVSVVAARCSCVWAVVGENKSAKAKGAVGYFGGKRSAPLSARALSRAFPPKFSLPLSFPRHLLATTGQLDRLLRRQINNQTGSIRSIINSTELAHANNARRWCVNAIKSLDIPIVHNPPFHHVHEPSSIHDDEGAVHCR